MSCNANCINTCVNRHRAARYPAGGLPDRPDRRTKEPDDHDGAAPPGRTARTPRTAERHERHGCRVRLATGPAAAAEARRRVRDAIRSWQVPVDLDAALLLTSELVTNAVRHEAGQRAQAVVLAIACSRGRLRVDVHDTSRSLPAVAEVPRRRGDRPRPAPGRDAVRRMGLLPHPGGQGRVLHARIRDRQDRRDRQTRQTSPTRLPRQADAARSGFTRGDGGP